MDAGLIEVVVEIPRGSRNKYELDKTRGVLVLDRIGRARDLYAQRLGGTVS